MESELTLTSIFILVLVITATAKSALDELSDVSLRLLASETEHLPHADFWRSILDRHHELSFTLTFGIHLSIASIAILFSSIALKIYPDHFLLAAFGGMILTVVIFRQIVPLIVTQNDPSSTLLRLRIPLRILWPALALGARPLYRALRGMQRESASDRGEAVEDKDETSESELQAFLDVGEEEGIIEESEGEMIQSIIRFSARTVAEVMTPRTNIVAVEASSSIEEVRDIMIESKYSRLPVYREQIDHIEGVIYVRDLISCWKDERPAQTAIDIARSTYFVPETKQIDELLHDMQRAKAPMAIVIDEYGGLAGLVTLEDLIEEIVGEIEDEDEPEPPETEVEIFDEGADATIVRGSVEVGKLERRFDIELAADDFTTVAGLVINQLGHLPAVGEQLDFKGLHFEVIEADERRVSRVRIRRLAEPDEAKAETAPARIENGK